MKQTQKIEVSRDNSSMKFNAHLVEYSVDGEYLGVIDTIFSSEHLDKVLYQAEKQSKERGIELVPFSHPDFIGG